MTALPKGMKISSCTLAREGPHSSCSITAQFSEACRANAAVLLVFLYRISSVHVFIESCSPRARLHTKHLANPPLLSLVWLNPSPSRSLVTPSGAPGGGGVLNKHTPHTSPPPLPLTGKYFPFPKAISIATARHAAAQHLTSPKTALKPPPKILLAFPSQHNHFQSRCTRVLRPLGCLCPPLFFFQSIS